MAFMHRFLCWNLRTASLVGFGFVFVTSFFAMILRALDLIAIGTDFEISQGFHTPWRSQFWRAFLSSDIVLIFFHILIFFFSIFMHLQVQQRHFVMYLYWFRKYIFTFILYICIEFIFSCFEYSFYGLNSFRLAFVVFTWLYWLGRTIVNIVFVVVLFARKQEIIEQTDMELRFAGERKREAFGY
ncbi:hypothetical protein CHS0354_030471 [Potamilus streckersoni]|uniref:Uncharacterized protein n=1 Tax=Potamilus streckersoni TaxID=2493646 RepID=A0AAE0VHS9_9BIVA|nr:hypothetical protein CHS0354_030471 [Potamilus streckersoni]